MSINFGNLKGWIFLKCCIIEKLNIFIVIELVFFFKWIDKFLKGKKVLKFLDLRFFVE